MKLFDECDIVFDQVYSYDTGVNALIAMANGKVVFSGFENCQKLKLNRDSDLYLDNIKCYGVNATDNPDSIYNCLLFLFENQAIVNDIKLNSLNRIIENHDCRKVSLEYLKVWNECDKK